MELTGYQIRELYRLAFYGGQAPESTYQVQTEPDGAITAQPSWTDRQVRVEQGGKRAPSPGLWT